MGFGDCRVCIRWVTTVPEYHMTQFELDFTSMCTSWKLISRVKDNHDLTRFEVFNFLGEMIFVKKIEGTEKKIMTDFYTEVLFLCLLNKYEI